MENFKKRVFGCAIIKAINSNYNADFSGRPRMLGNEVVFATDKAYKYAVKNYIRDMYSEEKVFSMKTLDENYAARDLIKTYNYHFGTDVSNDSVDKILHNLFGCIDLRAFGFTFAPKSKDKANKGKNVSMHGPVQVNHAVNIWFENNVYTEQIMSPYRNGDGENKEDDSDDTSGDKSATTLGRQLRLEEGHYLHHFSINPKNAELIYSNMGKDAKRLSDNDINILKEAMKRGVTYYDSAAKAGCENEMLVWVELKEESKIVLPNFTTLITLNDEKENGKYVFDFTKLLEKLSSVKNEIASAVISYDKLNTRLVYKKSSKNDKGEDIISIENIEEDGTYLEVSISLENI